MKKVNKPAAAPKTPAKSAAVSPKRSVAARKHTRASLAEAVISFPRNQADEVQALQDTIYVIGGKWKLPIINSICCGNIRFRAIERSIPGLTSRMLSRELKEMELNRIIRREVDADSPEKVTYHSTEYCHTFGDIILEMIRWGKEHRKKIRGK